MQMYVREVISATTLNLKYGTKDSLSFFFFLFEVLPLREESDCDERHKRSQFRLARFFIYLILPCILCIVSYEGSISGIDEHAE